MSFIDTPVLVGVCLVLAICLLGVIAMARGTGKSGE